MCVVSFCKVFFLGGGGGGVDNTCLSPLPLLSINDHFPKKNLYFIWQVLRSIQLTVSPVCKCQYSLFSGKVSQYLSSRISWKYWIKKKRNTLHRCVKHSVLSKTSCQLNNQQQRIFLIRRLCMPELATILLNSELAKTKFKYCYKKVSTCNIEEV